MTQSTHPLLSAVGIDVSKARFAIALLSHDETVSVREIANDAAEIRSFAETHLPDFQGKIIMESTGRFHLVSALTLAEAGYDVRLINPLLTKKHARGAIRKLKTDKADALLLARMSLTEHHLPDSFIPNRASLKIRKKMALITALEKNIQQMSATLKSYAATCADLSLPLSRAEQSLEKTLKELIREKERLIREVAEEAGGADTNAEQSAELLVSVPGVSPYTAALVATLLAPAHRTSPKQWIAYLGMDVSVKESGTWKGRAALTKRGNASLRKRLFAAAWGATMTNERFKEYYRYLKDQGRHHFEVLIIIARKILRICFALLKYHLRFDPTIPLFEHA